MATGDEVTGPMNLGNSEEITIRELAERIIAITGSRSRLVFEPRPTDDPVRRRPDIRLAVRVLGWRLRVGLDEGLERTVRYFADLVEFPG